MPWARVLDISLGGDPNFPISGPTFTTTTTQTPSATQSNTPTPTMNALPITQTTTISTTQTTTVSTTPSGTPNTQTVSVTQTTQSLSNTPTITGSNTVSSPSPSPTRPIQSINIQGPLNTISSTETPIQPSLVPSPTPSKSFQQIPALQTELIPINQEEINIFDSENNIIVQITFDSPNANEYLLISEPNDLPIVDRNRVQSLAVSLNLFNENGIEIQPPDSVEICLKADSDSKDSCLGFVNENASPPKWECEDNCLTENEDGLLCGETDHFTNFAILFTGLKNNNCDDDFDYIFDEAWKDGVLIGCVAAAIICFLVIGTTIIVASPFGSKIILGKEGHRISKLRTMTDTQAEVQ